MRDIDDLNIIYRQAQELLGQFRHAAIEAEAHTRADFDVICGQIERYCDDFERRAGAQP